MSKSVFGAMSVLLVLSVLATGCTTVLAAPNAIIGSGRTASRDYPVDGFNAVDVSSAFKVTLVQGDAYKVTVTADDNLLDYVSVKKQGSTVYISMDVRSFTSFRSRRQEASITIPELTGVRLSGASQASMSGFNAVDRFDAELSGASKLEGSVQATAISLEASGASHYSIEGRGTSLSLRNSGASVAELGRLAVDRASVDLSGASRATVNARSGLDYDLSGASRLDYSGQPAIGSARANGASRASRQ